MPRAKKKTSRKKATRKKPAQSSGKTARGRPFAKGKSGNPGGRPKIPDDVKDILRQRTPEAINALFDLVKNKKTSAMARVKGAEVIFGYALGKPKQAFEFSGPGGGPISTSDLDLSKLSTDELLQLRALRAKATVD